MKLYENKQKVQKKLSDLLLKHKDDITNSGIILNYILNIRYYTTILSKK